MKAGNLYRISNHWLLPHSTKDFWTKCGPVLYLGKDIVRIPDGEDIVNHAVLVNGQYRILDRTFLRFLEEDNNYFVNKASGDSKIKKHRGGYWE
mgnify:CR=1 FL=1|jgi:hypothetical protein